MTIETPNISNSCRTRSIVGLNIVSTLTHISQYGLGAMLIPIALEVKKATPELIGFTSAALWLGMLAGLLMAAKIIHNLGYRNTVLLSKDGVLLVHTLQALICRASVKSLRECQFCRYHGGSPQFAAFASP